MSDSDSIINPVQNRLCPRCKVYKGEDQYSPKGKCCRFCNNERVKAYYRSSPSATARLLAYRKNFIPPWRQIYGIKQRCGNPTNPSFKDYGGRGISIFPEWNKTPKSFMEYLGPRPSKRHSIERIDNSGNYEPGNVRWATTSEQQRNKRNNRTITAFGKSMLVVEWAEFHGINKERLYSRLNALGWSDSDAVGTPIGSPRGTLYPYLEGC